MPLTRLSIDAALAPQDPFSAIIDARSESEFALDHLPGAVNWPTLNDAERHAVGTEYKQISAFEARKRGAVIAARNIAAHIERHALHLPKSWRPLVYCWRGGQRSGALALILSQIGFDVQVLEGGYKAYRQLVVRELEQAGQGLSWAVLCGPTGSGKSRLLGELARQGAQVLDLEALAVHRGSLLGDIPGSPQPSQKAFENALWQQLRSFDPARVVFVESESRVVGRLRLPLSLIECMREAPCIRLELPIGARVQLLKQDYPHFVEQPERLEPRLNLLREHRGHVQVDEWLALLAQGQIEPVVEQLLLRHYDPVYQRSMSAHFRHLDQAEILALPGAEPETLARAAQGLLAGR